MGIKNTTTVVIGALISLLLFTKASCNKTPLDCANVKYGFQLPVRAYPNRDTVNIGDTIWLEINESTTFADNQSGETVDYSDAGNLVSAIGFSYRDTILRQWLDAVSRFHFSLVKGRELKRTPLDIEYGFVEETGSYLFKLGVIPKEKGLHSLLFSNSNNTYRTSDKCTKANFVINFKNTNQHYYLSPSYTGQTDLVGGDYYFVVR